VAQLTLVAQIAFVLSWLIAGLWQGARYSALSHSISDMYASALAHTGVGAALGLEPCSALGA
jgi:hypothetical protein